MPGEWVCLMYHDVAERLPGNGAGSFFSTSRERFARHLTLLRDAGFAGCSIADARAPGIERRIAISFDDGNEGQATHAFEALVANRMTATFFVTTGWIGRPGFATWSQLREMRSAGMAIESHTHSHPFLSELSESALRDELRRSRELLCEQLGEESTMLALPGGDPPRAPLQRLLMDEGYRTVATSRWGVNDGSQRGGAVNLVRRCTIRGEMADHEFLAVANGNLWLRIRKGAREGTLGFLRRSLGPTRYARWRRGLLDTTAGLTT